MPPTAEAISLPRRPMIDDVEVQALARHFGAPLRRTFTVQADEKLLTHRLRHDSDRRAEVVFAIQGPGEQLWLHTKHTYPFPIFRLPTGGIAWDETVFDALLREIDEETGLPVTVTRFLGLLKYRFYQKDQVSSSPLAEFASYVFLVHNKGSAPQSDGNEEVAAFRAILPCQLPQTSADLRNIFGERRAWGHWRALAHDIVYEVLTNI